MTPAERMEDEGACYQRPVLLDLFCGAGGASRGYVDAGFDVVGVDIAPQKNYPYEFVQMDALEYLETQDLSRFSAIHASPPCQGYLTLNNRWKGKSARADSHPLLIEPTRDLLKRTGLPYVIENVVPAPLRDTVTLCGSMFGLGVRRHRKFEASFFLCVPRCSHSEQDDHRGVYGDHPDGGRLWSRKGGGGVHRRAIDLEDGRRRMGIDWMTWRELCESIPPAYTRYIGRHLMEVLIPQRESWRKHTRETVEEQR
jgi:DNA (cytosine-5)-methyltransferase 1